MKGVVPASDVTPPPLPRQPRRPALRPLPPPLGQEPAGDDPVMSRNVAMKIPPKADDAPELWPTTAQRWVCVLTSGPRTKCEPFHSDAHLPPYPEHVVCPTCDSHSVRRWNEAIDTDEARAAVAKREVVPPDIRRRIGHLM